MSEKDIHGNNYNAHPETARNKWFNYSDAYIDKDGENQPVADYQEQFAQSVNNARDVSDSKDGMRHENNKGTFQALPETEQYGDTVTPVFLNKEVLASSKLSQDLGARQRLGEGVLQLQAHPLYRLLQRGGKRWQIRINARAASKTRIT